ncbi:MAG TPA: hypothetical protein VGL38_06530 [bacterium]|jgi:hypothetical protein
MVNNTQSYLMARAPISTMAFSGAVTTASITLNGAGGQSGTGFPVTRHGFVTGLTVWDGTTLRTDSTELALSAGDRISVYCQSTGSDYTVRVRINGSSSTLLLTGVPFNSTLFATVEFMLIRD